jgi:uncharacterized protein
MAKIFLLAIAVWLVITVLKRYVKNLQAPTESPENLKSVDMVQCAHCGVHLPTSDSFLVSNKYYCCEAHSSAAHTTPSKP